MVIIMPIEFVSTNPLEKIQSNPQNTEEIKLKNNNFILPNGKQYFISKFKIDGKEIEVSKLSSEQLQSIALIADKLFKSVSSLNLKRNDLNSIGIMATPNKTTAVTVNYKDSTDTQSVKEEKVNRLIHQEFKKKFPSCLAENIQRVKTTQTIAQHQIQFSSAYGDGQELDGMPGNEEPLTKTSARLIGPKTLPSEQVITHTYSIDGQDYATQYITRDTTVDQTIEFCKNMISHLRVKLEKASEEDKTKIMSKLRLYENSLNNAKKFRENEDWLSSDYFRGQIRESGFAQATESYVSAPVNMRYQELQVDGKKEVGFYRVGIMSDMRNGFYSLSDLKSFKNEPKKVNDLIQNLSKKLNSKLTNDQRVSIENALNNLKIMRGSPSYIDIVYQERKMMIEQQMVQLIAGQVRQNPQKVLEAFEAGNSFDLVHVALLNQRKSEMGSTGWVHDERVEMEDMQEIFAEFNGKKLCFNGTGPLIDGDMVYLPYQIKASEIVTIPLATAFFNTSVQGNTHNNKTQLKINTQQLRQLLISHPHLFDKFPEIKKSLLEDSSTSYTLAEELIMVLLSSKTFCVSLGCLSAKDRTGLVAERLMLRHLHPHLPSKRKHDFDKSIFDPNGPAVRVVTDNTPKFKVLKVNPRASLPQGFNFLDRIKMVYSLLKASF